MKVGDDSISMNMQKDSKGTEKRVRYSTKSPELEGGDLVSSRCRNKLVSEQIQTSNGRRSRANSGCQELFLPNIRGLHSSIPKRITTYDENYVFRSLELIRNCAVRAAAGNFASKVHIVPDDLSNLVESKSSGSPDMAKLAIQSSLVAQTKVAIKSTDDWTIGSVTGSQSMVNILKSPLLQQYGSIEFDVNLERTHLRDVTKLVYSNFVDSPQKFSNILSRNKYVSAAGHKRLVSTSSTNSSCSDSSSSSSSTLFQGMLQCTWKDGLPQHVFSVDNKREVYVANLSKVESSYDKVLDYVYTFYEREKAKREHDCEGLELESVGTMRVSTSVSFFSNNSQVRETQFILTLSGANPASELQLSNHSRRKNNRLVTKVVKVFRSSHSYKQRSSSKLSTAIFEDAYNSVDPLEAGAENDYMPSLELAAIIVKETRKEADLGGWGLKFLKKLGNDASLDTFASSECTRNNGECLTSMDILIPASLHGGPITGVGRPSSLRERWISGGHCDCGGWDIGCPLTILNTRSIQLDNSGECKSIDLFVQGSKQDAPILRMVNIHEGLYYIHFQPNLSTLQSFAIAAAIIHSRSPVLR